MDILSYTSREGFLARRLRRRTREESEQLWEQRHRYRRLYFKYAAGGEEAERSLAERRADLVAKSGLTEAELERGERRRYVPDDGSAGGEIAEPGPGPEADPAAGLASYYELTDEDRRLMRVSGLTEEEYVEVMFGDDSADMPPLTRQPKAAVESRAAAEDDESDDDDDDDGEGASLSLSNAADDAASSEHVEHAAQYDSDGFLKEEYAGPDSDLDTPEGYERFYLEMFPPAAAGAEQWRRDAALVCLRLVQAVDEKLDVCLRVEDVATWLGWARRDPETGGRGIGTRRRAAGAGTCLRDCYTSADDGL